MVYTPSQNNSPLYVNDVNSSTSYQSSESGFNSSSQWLRRRFEQSQEISSASEVGDQFSPLLLRGKSGNKLTLGARSTGLQPFNTLSPVQKQHLPTPTSPTSPTSPAYSQLQGLIREQSNQSQFQPSSTQGIAQQDNTNRLMSFVSTPQNATPFFQSNIAPINVPTYTGSVRTSDTTFGVSILGNRFEGQPIYLSEQNIIGHDMSGMKARIADTPLVQSTPAPKPRQQQTSSPHKVEDVPYLARLLIVEQELPKNEFEVEKRYLLFVMPVYFIYRVFYVNIQWNKKKKQINQIREQLMKELEQNSSYDPSCYTISPSRPSRSIDTPTTSTVVVSSIPTQSTIFPSSMSLPYTGISTSTIIPSASSSNSFINAWGSGGTPFPQRIPPTTKYRQATYVTPSKIDENVITVGNVLARLQPNPKPTDRET
ncbi:12140_t:CDS:2 [Funneliformis geosporum]|uniref:13104_t:CDS:1 n=1 Tax=Funneliformis geosporum TaxID=1117311 RepID=A0A9W4WU38_9GLOM|nr:12140_t:CDS:2 [Funneliformis geosporum]CAI2179032.1 13104_t:CDS:2 [Funneliformis geosporum]